jgi:hypothetical protein
MMTDDKAIACYCFIKQAPCNSHKEYVSLVGGSSLSLLPITVIGNRGNVSSKSSHK